MKESERLEAQRDALAREAAEVEKQIEEMAKSGEVGKCKVCGEEFEPKQPNQVFCSPLCRVLYWKARRAQEPSIKICRNCGHQFPAEGNRKVFCSDECADDYKLVTQKVTLPEISKTTRSVRFRVLMRDNFRCQYCGRSPVSDSKVVLVVDHVIPRSKGGTDELSNLVTACFDCNIGKRDVLLDTATRDEFAKVGEVDEETARIISWNRKLNFDDIPRRPERMALQCPGCGNRWYTEKWYIERCIEKGEPYPACPDCGAQLEEVTEPTP